MRHGVLAIEWHDVTSLSPWFHYPSGSSTSLSHHAGSRHLAGHRVGSSITTLPSDAVWVFLYPSGLFMRPVLNLANSGASNYPSWQASEPLTGPLLNIWLSLIADNYRNAPSAWLRLEICHGEFVSGVIWPVTDCDGEGVKSVNTVDRSLFDDGMSKEHMLWNSRSVSMLLTVAMIWRCGLCWGAAQMRLFSQDLLLNHPLLHIMRLEDS